MVDKKPETQEVVEEEKKIDEQQDDKKEGGDELLQVNRNNRSNQQAILDHKFWSTQPVPKSADDSVLESGPIDRIKTVEEILSTPLKLPEHYEWVEVDLNDDEQLNGVYTLLAENYVEDEDNMFRFDYSPAFLRWALTPPEYYKNWILGVRVIKSKKLVGFITGIPVHMHLEQKDKRKMAEINFLCVNKKLRHNRLAPVLIKEITRRVNRENIWQAVYTAGVVVPTPITKARYYHRSLNPLKLIDINFSSLGKNQTRARVVKLYRLPEETNIEGLRPMKKQDIGAVHKLLNNYLSQFQLHQKFTEAEIKHFLLPRDEVVYTYVVEQDKQITDFFSFYYLPSTIIKVPKYDKLKAVYSYYNVSTVTPLEKLMENALILAKQLDFDVFNALDIMHNTQFLKELMFSPGDGNLHYYLYNWRLGKKIEAKDLGMVLV